MTYPFKAWLDHPSHNQLFRLFTRRGRHFYERSRWIPHQGKRERARRLAAAE